MTTLFRQPQEARTRDILLVLVGVFGLSASITLIWLGRPRWLGVAAVLSALAGAAAAVWALSTLAT